MTDWLRVVIAIVTWPLRGAWKLYSLSWWAFEDDRPKNQSPETIARKRPDRALKHGFAVTLVATLVAAWAARFGVHAGVLTPPQAAGGTLWVLGASWVLSLFTVRRREKKEVFANAKTAPLGLPQGTEKLGRRARFADAAKAYSTFAKAGFGKAGRFALGAGKLGKAAFAHAAQSVRKSAPVS